MLEDHLERKTYRKSPGRQYGYEYDPLQSHSGRSQHGSTASRSGTLLSQRPDPRRTRQLLRQSIIASRRSDDETLEEVQSELGESAIAVDRSRPTRHIHHSPLEQPRPSMGRMPRTRFIPMHDEDEPLYSRHGAKEAYMPSSREFIHEDEVVQEAWPHQERERYVDPDLGIDEDADEDLEQEAYDYVVPPRARRDHAGAPLRPSRASGQLKPRHATTRRLPEELLEQEPDEGYIDEDYVEEDEDLPSGLHLVEKPSSSRRKLLIGAGVLVAGGVGVAAFIASQSAPKAPLTQALNNTEKQVQDAAQKAADDARRELLASLDTIENFTLTGAIDAARLTRVAYDVFVSPIIKFGSTVTGDFLGGMLSAFKVARSWLAGINQDNVTLAAIQKVLEAWVQQVQNLPKQLDAITQTDLDGAQAYLRALQRKIETERNALNNPASTPTPSTTPKKP